MESNTENPVNREIEDLIRELYPICRSITGNGVRKSLEIVSNVIPIKKHEVPSNTSVFDWTVPNEWNIRDAWIKNLRGERVVDFRESNLHVVNYSAPINARLPREELLKHIHTLPEHPDWIPYRTSYYNETWGFCIKHNQLETLNEAEYDVCIDSTLEPGHLSYGELFLEGEQEDEIIISTHICHPSLCNDNLSGLAVSTYLAKILSQKPRRYSYRFLYIPGTIGAITWLALNENRTEKIRHGLTLMCLGDSANLTYKKSFTGENEIDHAVIQILKESGKHFDTIDFFPYGYDERQFNSPGFRLPVGSLMRGRHGIFPEYHTSADNLDFILSEKLIESLECLVNVFRLLESNRTYINLNPKCEPQLGKRGIYREMADADKNLQLAMLWVLNLSDGHHNILDICERSGMRSELVIKATDILLKHNLLKKQC